MITGISFVGIVVNNLEEAQSLYADTLELEPWDQGIVEMPGVKVVMFPLDGGCSIELLQPTVGTDDPVGGGLARWLERRGEGLCRLGLWVDNIDEEVKRLKESGVQVMDSGEYGEIGEQLGARMAFIHPKSTLGVLVELDQQM
jgi:methylmalonyl-CoA/ethylmalonyl-CoA epimerase